MDFREPSIQQKMEHLKLLLEERGSMLVAFSGGVDSSFLLAVAVEVLHDDVIALMTVSSSTPPEDAQQATALAQSLQVRMLTIQHDELAISEYAANPTNRCYFCKNSLYEICRREAARLGVRSVVDGVNMDDLKDYRPGLQAAEEYGVVHPLVEARFSKEDIRRGSQLLGLSTWDKPASPCLSSRVPYGTTITSTMLSQISQGESFLRSLGFKELRVRHHSKSARLELREEDLTKITTSEMIKKIDKRIKEIGFTSVLLDLEGYRSGVFNEGLHSK